MAARWWPSSTARPLEPAQIAGEHAFSRQLVQAEVPVVAPLELQGSTVHQHAGFAFSVSPWRGGRARSWTTGRCWNGLAAFWPACTAWARSSLCAPPDAGCPADGLRPLHWLLAHGDIPPHVQPAGSGCEAALAMARDALADPAARHPPAWRLPPRQHPVDAGGRQGQGGPHFVDLDDARMGPAVQDLWMLLSGDRRQRSQQLSTLLEGYEQLRDFDRRELALIEPLRTLRLIHYSAWLAQRWQDPAFPRAFPGLEPKPTGWNKLLSCCPRS
jgi:hypothetical protein